MSLPNSNSPIRLVFEITLDEAIALNKLLRIHHGLFREQAEYEQILRLINGLGMFVDRENGQV
jgi:hypothetical protein